jgi:hypothetical protein
MVGFGFKGNVRPPFDGVIALFGKSKLPIVAVDVPSGWDVEAGNVNGALFEPEMLISLTAPKLCAVSVDIVHKLTTAKLQGQSLLGRPFYSSVSDIFGSSSQTTGTWPENLNSIFPRILEHRN